MRHEKIVIRYTTSKNERTYAISWNVRDDTFSVSFGRGVTEFRIVGKAVVRRRPKHSDLLYTMFKDVAIFSEDTREIAEVKEIFAMADTDIMALRKEVKR